MMAVIFEVIPADGRRDDFLAHAARLREDLIEIVPADSRALDDTTTIGNS